MDTTKSQAIASLTSLTHMPSHIIVGPANHALQQVKSALKKIYCPFNICKKCIHCLQIDQQQHPALIWICPEKQYTLDYLEIIFKTISFRLEHNNHFFFILQKAETLSAACANSLLKSMEEPPAGYHFILLTERIEAILPTIRSRCLISTLPYNGQETSFFDLFQAIIHPTKVLPSQFLKIIESSKINEHESLMLLDKILAHWAADYKKAIHQNDHSRIIFTEQCISIISDALKNPPMPGSSILLWKNVYLAMYGIS
jgi:DNA polymerase-3 subunit delta'